MMISSSCCNGSMMLNYWFIDNNWKGQSFVYSAQCCYYRACMCMQHPYTRACMCLHYTCVVTRLLGPVCWLWEKWGKQGSDPLCNVCTWCFCCEYWLLLSSALSITHWAINNTLFQLTCIMHTLEHSVNKNQLKLNERMTVYQALSSLKWLNSTCPVSLQFLHLLLCRKHFLVQHHWKENQVAWIDYG